MMLIKSLNGSDLVDFNFMIWWSVRNGRNGSGEDGVSSLIGTGFIRTRIGFEMIFVGFRKESNVELNSRCRLMAPLLPLLLEFESELNCWEMMGTVGRNPIQVQLNQSQIRDFGSSWLIASTTFWISTSRFVFSIVDWSARYTKRLWSNHRFRPSLIRFELFWLVMVAQPKLSSLYHRFRKLGKCGPSNRCSFPPSRRCRVSSNLLVHSNFYSSSALYSPLFSTIIIIVIIIIIMMCLLSLFAFYNWRGGAKVRDSIGERFASFGIRAAWMITVLVDQQLWLMLSRFQSVSTRSGALKLGWW